jgi:hypothetical protein
MEGGGIARWNWRAIGPTAKSALDVWYPFLLRHQALEFNEYGQRVSMKVQHEFAVHREGQPVPGPEFPRSSTTAHLQRFNAMAFLDLVFPYGSIEPAFLDDYRAVCEATGLRLPPRRIPAQHANGDGRPQACEAADSQLKACRLSEGVRLQDESPRCSRCRRPECWRCPLRRFLQRFFDLLHVPRGIDVWTEVPWTRVRILRLVEEVPRILVE